MMTPDYTNALENAGLLITRGMFTGEHWIIDGELIDGFAQASGDYNPVHMNNLAAEMAGFKGRIAHGAMSVAFISELLGNRLPGPGSIYVSQNVKFLKPVYVGDVLHVAAEVQSVDAEKKRVNLRTFCSVDADLVVDGDAVIYLPRAKRDADLVVDGDAVVYLPKAKRVEV